MSSTSGMLFISEIRRAHSHFLFKNGWEIIDIGKSTQLRYRADGKIADEQQFFGLCNTQSGELQSLAKAFKQYEKE